MSMKMYLGVLSLLGLLSVGCNMNTKDKVESAEIKYFGTFSGYSIPLTLTDEMTRSAALQKDAYYVGFYDDDHRLTCVEKYLNGNLFFRHSYIYREDGTIKENRILNADGVETVNSFDEKGSPIRGSGQTQKSSPFR